MPGPLAPDPSSVGVIDGFKGNFTKALNLRSQPSGELERRLAERPGGPAQVLAAKAAHIARLQIKGHERLAKVLPVGPGADYPVGAGIYQCNIPRPIQCAVAAFIASGNLPRDVRVRR